MMVVDNKYNIGEVVYLFTDEDQLKRIITGINVRSGMYIIYELSCGTVISDHIESEIVKEKQYV